MSGSRLTISRKISLGGVIVGFCAAAASPALADAAEKDVAGKPQPPEVVAVPPAPPPPPPVPIMLQRSERGSRASGSMDGAPVVLDVTAMKGRERLLADSLTVGGRSGASLNRSKSQYGGPCPGDDESSRSTRSLNESLRLNIYPSRNRDSDPESFRVSLSVQSPWGDCASQGSNSLGIERNLALNPGQSQVLEGPDGLTLRISRRK